MGREMLALKSLGATPLASGSIHRPWELPAGLPAGGFVVPALARGEGRLTSEPALWVSREPPPGAGQLWARLFTDKVTSGLWPLLLLGPHIPGRAAEQARVPVPAETIADLDAAKVPARWWRVVTGTDEDRAGCSEGGPVPGVARAGSRVPGGGGPG